MTSPPRWPSLTTPWWSTPKAPPCCRGSWTRTRTPSSPARGPASTGSVLAGRAYADILAGGGGINATVRATRAATAEELAALTRRRLDSFLSHGTTTLEIKSGYGLTLADERKILAARRRGRIRRAGCAPSLGRMPCPTSSPAGPTTTWSLSAARCCLPSRGEAEFVDVFCDAGAFTRRAVAARAAGGPRARLQAEDPRRGARAFGGSPACRRARLCLGRPSRARHVGGDRALSQHASVVAVALPGTSFTLGAPMRRRVPSWRRASLWRWRPTSIREPATARTCRWSSHSPARRCT